MFSLTIGEIANFLKGDVKGHTDIKIHQISKIQEGQPGSISFLANQKYEPYIYDTQCSAVLVSKKFEPKNPINTNLIRVEDPYSAFGLLLDEYIRIDSLHKKGLEDPCLIDTTTKNDLGKNIYIGAFAYIGKNVKIGDNVKIFPQVYIEENVTIEDNTVILAGAKILKNTQIGAYCTIHPGAVIGSQGFGFSPLQNGSYRAIPQIGNVVIKNHVSVGSNTTIDCATMDSTIIEEGTKIDNLVQIAHNVKIGKHSIVAGQAGISGSTILGDYCMLGGQVGLSGHLQIADQTKFAAQSGLTKSIMKKNTTYMGSPAFERGNYLKSAVIFRKLPDMLKKIEAIEQTLIKNKI